MRIVALLIGLFTALASLAQFSIEARLDTASILVGQQTHLRLLATGVSNPTAIEWPDFREALPSEIELIETSAARKVQGQEDSYEITLVITAWDSGYYAIEPVPINYLGKEVMTEAMLFTVNNIPVDLKKAPHTIKEIYAEPFSLIDWIRNNWVLLLFVLLGLLLSFLVYYLIKRSGGDRVKQEIQQAKVKLPAHEHALERLSILKQSDMASQGDKKPFYSELTEILREYLEERFFVPALEQTSDETLESVRYLGLDQQWQDHFRSLLRTADMVKFAKERTKDGIAEQLMSRSKEFILDTVPVAVEELIVIEEDE